MLLKIIQNALFKNNTANVKQLSGNNCKDLHSNFLKDDDFDW